jgi:thiol-disulfide isomerase/thioredoxin
MAFRRLANAGWFLLLASALMFSARVASTAPPVDNKAETRKKSLPADELVDEARRTAQGGDLKKATELLEEAVKAEPQNRNALYWLGRVCQERAIEMDRPQSTPLILRSAQAMRALRDAHKKDLNEQESFLLGVALYTEARSYAVDKKKDRALASLGEAIDSGFDRLDLLEEDEDLATIRDTPEFQKLKKEAEAKALIAAREHAKELLAKNKTFKFDFKLPDLNGKIVTLADFKGKVTIVDFWGTWCPPCRKEIPHFIELLKKYKEKGLEIVGLTYEQIDDKAEAKDTIKTFVKENRVPYACLIGDDKTQDQVPNFEGFPTTLFVDRTGKVRLKLVAYNPMATLEAIVSMLLDEATE